MRYGLFLLCLAASAVSAAAQHGQALRGRQLASVEGEVHTLLPSDGGRGTAIVFLGTTCPIALRYAPLLEELAADAAAHDVNFYGVFAGADVTRDEVEAFAERAQVSFPLLLDPTGSLIDALNPNCVPEAFVLRPAGGLAYRGAIDDTYSDVSSSSQVQRRWLRDALQTLGTDEDRGVARVTQAFGCLIEEPTALEAPRYRDHIAPIVRAACGSCHGSEGEAPFTLDRASDLLERPSMLAHVLQRGMMPPALGDAHPDHLAGHPGLHTRELDALLRWLEQPAAGDEELASGFPAASGATLAGEPDVTVRATLPPLAERGAATVRLVQEIALDAPKHGAWLHGVERSERAGVRRADLYLARAGLDAHEWGAPLAADPSAIAAQESRRLVFLGSLAANATALELPAGSAVRRLPGDRLVVELIAQTTDADDVALELWLQHASAAPAHELVSLALPLEAGQQDALGAALGGRTAVELLAFDVVAGAGLEELEVVLARGSAPRAGLFHVGHHDERWSWRRELDGPLDLGAQDQLIVHGRGAALSRAVLVVQLRAGSAPRAVAVEASAPATHDPGLLFERMAGAPLFGSAWPRDLRGLPIDQQDAFLTRLRRNSAVLATDAAQNVRLGCALAALVELDPAGRTGEAMEAELRFARALELDRGGLAARIARAELRLAVGHEPLLRESLQELEAALRADAPLALLERGYGTLADGHAALGADWDAERVRALGRGRLAAVRN